MIGFTFNDRHCERDMKIRYIPDAEARAGYAADMEIKGEDDETKDGWVSYTTRVKERSFDLDCYFEEITQEELRKIERWLRETGELIFDNMAFCKWNVIPAKEPEISKWPVWSPSGKLWSGTITIHFVAPDPFAAFMVTTAENGSDGANETGLLSAAMMPAAPTSTASEFLIYNPGNVPCGLLISVGGNAQNGVTFTNMTTDQVCTLKGFSRAETTSVGMRVDANGETMQTFYRGSTNQALAYRFHEDGYIWLAPSTPIEKELHVTYSNGSNVVRNADGLFRKCMVGQYIYLNGQWRPITEFISREEIRTGWTATVSGDEMATVVTMNRIKVERAEGTALDTIEISYTPKLNIR